ncbi:F0F1 ATP synthase subunit A [Kineosporiaceae bacterium SCSIO 59966]|nr:F0F1 ATP synthase subunit A [Kineosporiaceae bacterium SCSIO 59966]
MSPLVLAAEGFNPPTPGDFWQPLIGDGAFAVTRSMFVIAISVVLIAWFMTAVARRMAVVPGKLQFAGEGVYNFVRNSVAIDILGSRNFRPFLPLLLTQFLLILVNNWFGVLPPIQFPTFSRIGFAIAVTLVTFVVYHAVGIRRKGLGGYFKGLMPPGIPGWISPFVYVLELMTFFITRPLTLGMRLFANMFAGHMLLLVFILGGEYMLLHGGNLFVNLSSVAAFVMAIVMTFFELLVQFLQAYVFVLLTALYIAGSLADEH